MGVRYDGLITAHKPGAAIAAYRLLQQGTSDGEVIQAAGTTKTIIGVCTRVEAAATDPTVEAVRGGIPEVEYSGPVTRGDPLTSDANGKAVKAAPGGGAIAHIAGFAEVSGVSGDIGALLFCPSIYHGV